MCVSQHVEYSFNIKLVLQTEGVKFERYGREDLTKAIGSAGFRVFGAGSILF